jgi:hypothetical protein
MQETTFSSGPVLADASLVAIASSCLKDVGIDPPPDAKATSLVDFDGEPVISLKLTFETDADVPPSAQRLELAYAIGQAFFSAGESRIAHVFFGSAEDEAPEAGVK